MRPHTGKIPGYCYTTGRETNSRLLGRVTRLLFCLHVKLFLPSVFNIVKFRNNMSHNALAPEPTDTNIIKELGVPMYENVQGYSFCPSKTENPEIHAVWCTKSAGILWNSGSLENSDLMSILSKNERLNVSWEEQEKVRFFAIQWTNVLGAWMIMVALNLKRLQVAQRIKNLGFVKKWFA